MKDIKQKNPRKQRIMGQGHPFLLNAIILCHAQPSDSLTVQLLYMLFVFFWLMTIFLTTFQFSIGLHQSSDTIKKINTKVFTFSSLYLYASFPLYINFMVIGFAICLMLQFPKIYVYNMN